MISNCNFFKRLGSVTPLDDPEVEAAEEYRERVKIFAKNKDVIDEIKEVLRGGDFNQTEIYRAVMGNSGFSKRVILRVLKEHTGFDAASFLFWTSRKTGKKNETIYTLLDEK